MRANLMFCLLTGLTALSLSESSFAKGNGNGNERPPRKVFMCEELLIAWMPPMAILQRSLSGDKYTFILNSSMDQSFFDELGAPNAWAFSLDFRSEDCEIIQHLGGALSTFRCIGTPIMGRAIADEFNLDRDVIQRKEISVDWVSIESVIHIGAGVYGRFGATAVDIEVNTSHRNSNALATVSFKNQCNVTP